MNRHYENIDATDDTLDREFGDNGQNRPRKTDPHRHYYIFCDESGFNGTRYYGYGTLWIPYERRGDFSALISKLRYKHHYTRDEMKWNHIRGSTYSFYEDLVKEFFRIKWLMFHGLIVRKGYVDKSFHGGSYDLARRKHFTMLLANKIRRFATATKRFRVRVDPIHSGYAKAGEAVEKIANSSIAQKIGLRPIDNLIEVDSKETSGVQLCDVFTGAIVDAWEHDSRNREKQELKNLIAKTIGWPDLQADTYKKEWKFNIWYFRGSFDPKCREADSREVHHRFAVRGSRS